MIPRPLSILDLLVAFLIGTSSGVAYLLLSAQGESVTTTWPLLLITMLAIWYLLRVGKLWSGE
jgi:hypothetical protein